MTLAVRWGYKPTPAEHHRAAFSLLRGLEGTRVSSVVEDELPRRVELGDYAPGTMDQGPYGSCMGHARASAITLAMRVAGTPLPWVASPDALYKLARCAERAAHTPRDKTLPTLVDEGAYPSYVNIAANEWGVVEMGVLVGGRYSDCGEPYGDLDRVNDEPDFAKIESCSSTLVTGEYAIIGGRAAVELAVRQALAHGIPVEVDGFVDTAYLDWNQPDEAYDSTDFADPDGGGHAQYVLGYMEVSPGVYWYEVQNSWGSGWANNGRVWVTGRFLVSRDEIIAVAARRA